MLGALIVIPSMATAKIAGRYAYRKMIGLPPWLQVEVEGSDAEDENQRERDLPGWIEPSHPASTLRVNVHKCSQNMAMIGRRVQ